jgi:hypothetical protein
MLTREEYMDVLGRRRLGWTINEIADDLGYHPATVSKWLKASGHRPPGRCPPRKGWLTSADGFPAIEGLPAIEMMRSRVLATTEGNAN